MATQQQPQQQQHQIKSEHDEGNYNNSNANGNGNSNDEEVCVRFFYLDFSIFSMDFGFEREICQDSFVRFCVFDHIWVYH